MPSQNLTPIEARRAIYLDFEGTKTDQPSLLGSLWIPGRRKTDARPPRYQVDIIEGALAGAVDAVMNNGRADYVSRSRPLAWVIRDLVGLAEKQDRELVSWSRHEVIKIQAAGLPDELVARFEARWVDGKKVARRWKSILHPEVSFERAAFSGGNKLVRYFELAGYEPSPRWQTPPARAIRKVRAGLALRGEFGRLVPSQKEQWLGLIWHNFDDCNGMRHVVTTAADELAAMESQK